MTDTERHADRNRCQEEAAAWKACVSAYKQPDRRRAGWQLINTLGTYAALWCLLYLSLSVSWWLTIPLAVIAGGVLVRVFIIFHDCGHGSFLPSRRANAFWGFVTGLLAFTPYHHWRWEHGVHHATSGNLDRRGMGDVHTMTVDEYLRASRLQRIAYRLVRHPFILFVVAPLHVFLTKNRWPSPGAKARERRSVWVTNLAVIGMVAGLIAIFGFLPWLIIQLTIMMVAGSGGVWLFYIQHQFEDVYWNRSEDWDFTEAALKGSSFYKLPKVLQWFSGNIGFHHIHHLSARIPNYHLERCHRASPLFTDVKPMTLTDSLRSLSLRLYDERARRLIGFRQLREQLG